MPPVPPRREVFVIRLSGGQYYWEPSERTSYKGPNRTCVSQRAAVKYDSEEKALEAAHRARLKGFTVVPYNRPY